LCRKAEESSLVGGDAVESAGGTATIAVEDGTIPVSIMPLPTRPSAVRHEQAVRPDASLPLSMPFLDLPSAGNSIVGFNSNDIGNDGSSVIGVDGSLFFARILHGNTASGVAGIVGYHDPSIDWNAETPADSGGAVADLLIPAASESAPADPSETQIPPIDLDAVPSVSDLFASPTESASDSFAFFIATGADVAQDLLVVDVHADASSAGPAVLASVTNPAAHSFGVLVADNFPNGAVAAPAPQGTLGYDLPHADFDVAGPAAAGTATTVVSFAVAESAPAPAGAASLANPPADSFAAPITDSAIGADGATAAQVLQAMDDSGLSVNGSGIKVGVISDSFNDLGGAAADEADGALPSAANIDVIKDLASGGTDEGRAMMQIIHDIAPGASLAFYTAYESEQDFANGILALAAAGSKVIVDDVSYFDEPFFQNGVVAQAIQTVEAEGVVYVTAAGNDASNAYQSAWTPISGTYDGKTLTDAESFAGSLTQTVTINTEGTGYDVPLLLEWNQAYGAATSDLELLVFNSRGQLVGTATNAADGEPTNPWVEYDFSKSGTYHVAIENLSGPDPGLIKEITEGDGLPATISGANAGTVFGHAMTPGAISAGAVSAADTPAFGFSPVSESFSSSGAGTELLFANNGAALSSPDQLSPVAVSGVDDIATTVSGGLSDFYGTSAASASLAGAAALILSANPNLTPAAVELLMEETALPMANAAVSGAGLVQLDPAVEDVESGNYASATAAPTLAITSTGGLTNQATQTISGTIDSADASLTVSIYDGTTLLGTVIPAANGNWSKSVTLLAAQGPQAITAQATDAAGNVGTSGSVTYTLDTIAPALAITSTGSLTNQTTQTISGTIDSADAGLTVSIYDGVTLLGTVIPTANGSWSKSVTLLPAQGAHAITAHAMDAAGNVGTSGAITYTLDTIAPTLTHEVSVSVTAGTTVSVPGSQLQFDDTLSTHAQETYTVITAPVDGTLLKNGSATSSFTQADIDSGSISYHETAGNASSDSFTFKVTDAVGNQTSAQQFQFHISPVVTVIEAFGSTELVQAGNNYFFYPVGGSSGPEFNYGGPVTANEFAGWAPIGVEATSSGYDVAWENAGAGQFTVWATDHNGNYLSSIIGVVSATDANLEAIEATFQQDLNGDGTIGLPSSSSSPSPTTTTVTTTVIESYGSTELVQAGNDYFFYPIGGSSGPEFSYGGPVTANEFAGWAPIGVEATSSGYDVAWENAGAGQFTVWATDHNGNYLSSIIGVVSGTDANLEAIETTFQQDLNGDGTIGLLSSSSSPPPTTTTVTTTVIESHGSTELVQAGNNYFFYPVGGSSGPEFNYGGPVTANEFAGWAPIGVEATSSGYDVAWENAGAGQFTVWATDHNGNYLSSIVGVASATDANLEAIETTFQQDLNSDGVTGPLVKAGAVLELSSAYNGPATFAGSTGTLQLDASSGFSGTIIGFTGQDLLDLRDINFSTLHTPTYSGTSSGGALTVTDGVHTAQIDLTGNYLASSFVPSNDGQGGTDIVDPPATDTSFSTSVSSSVTGSDVSGTIAFAAVDHSNILTASFAPDSTADAGSFSLAMVGANSGQVSLGFEFSLDNDQINLAPGQTLTQSYSVSLVDPQNPTANLEQTVSVSIGGPGNDNFVFHPGIGADTIINFDPHQDTIELDNFTNLQALQQLQSIVTPDIHGNAFIDLGHGDSITFAGTTAAQLQAVLQSAVHLH